MDSDTQINEAVNNNVLPEMTPLNARISTPYPRTAIHAPQQPLAQTVVHAPQRPLDPRTNSAQILKTKWYENKKMSPTDDSNGMSSSGLISGDSRDSRGRNQNRSYSGGYGSSAIREPRPGPGARGMQCTHITMTRFYNPNFVCSMCREKGELGWLYRCTQDRDVMLDNDLALAHHLSIDSLLDDVGSGTDPKARSAGARIHPMSYINEMTPEQLNQYTHHQLNTLYNQRANLLHVANLHTQQREWMNHRLRGALSLNYNARNSAGSVPHIRNPWDVLQDFECQFKVCHKCRHHCADRSFLSLNAVCNGEIPLTAAVGFGFKGERPVMLVKHALNFGQRQNPPVKKKTQDEIWAEILREASHRPLPYLPVEERKVTPPERGNTPFDDPEDLGTTFGQTGTNAYDSSAMVRKHVLENAQYKDVRRPNKVIPKDQRYYLQHVLATNEDRVQRATVQEGWDIRLPVPAEQLALMEVNEVNSENGSPMKPMVRRAVSLAHPPKHRTKSDEKKLKRRSLTTSMSTLTIMSDDAQAGSSAAGTLAHSHSYASSDALTAFSRTPPIPSETGWANEIAHEAGYETDMERCERETHHFSSEPLVVAEGVAVTEEGVAEHIPDVVTERHV